MVYDREFTIILGGWKRNSMNPSPSPNTGDATLSIHIRENGVAATNTSRSTNFVNVLIKMDSSVLLRDWPIGFRVQWDIVRWNINKIMNGLHLHGFIMDTDKNITPKKTSIIGIGKVTAAKATIDPNDADIPCVILCALLKAYDAGELLEDP